MTMLAFPVAAAARIAPAVRKNGLFARFFRALMTSQERRAQEVIRRHAHLLPNELEVAAWKINERSEDSLPFVR